MTEVSSASGKRDIFYKVHPHGTCDSCRNFWTSSHPAHIQRVVDCEGTPASTRAGHFYVFHSCRYRSIGYHQQRTLIGKFRSAVIAVYVYVFKSDTPAATKINGRIGFLIPNYGMASLLK